MAKNKHLTDAERLWIENYLRVCNDFVEQVCLKLYEPPYCCNGCVEEHQCVLRKKYYRHRKAHEAYRARRRQSFAYINVQVL